MISILIPTRKRPALLKQCIDSAVAHQDPSSYIEFLIYYDNDDNDTPNFINQEYPTQPTIGNYHVYGMQGDRIPLSDTYNQLFNKYSPCDIIMYAADDLKFNDKGWNILVEETFKKYNDRIVLVFGKDGIHENFPTHGFIHYNWVNCLNQVFPNWLWGEYADSYMDEVAGCIGRRERIELYIEHIHYSRGKRVDDEVDHEKFRKQAEHGCINRFHSTRHEREADALKLLQFIRDYKNDHS